MVKGVSPVSQVTATALADNPQKSIDEVRKDLHEIIRCIWDASAQDNGLKRNLKIVPTLKDAYELTQQKTDFCNLLDKKSEEELRDIATSDKNREHPFRKDAELINLVINPKNTRDTFEECLSNLVNKEMSEGFGDVFFMPDMNDFTEDEKNFTDKRYFDGILGSALLSSGRCSSLGRELLLEGICHLTNAYKDKEQLKEAAATVIFAYAKGEMTDNKVFNCDPRDPNDLDPIQKLEKKLNISLYKK